MQTEWPSLILIRNKRINEQYIVEYTKSGERWANKYLATYTFYKCEYGRQVTIIYNTKKHKYLPFSDIYEVVAIEQNLINSLYGEVNGNS